jgi:flagellar hook-length control protein FliK
MPAPVSAALLDTAIVSLKNPATTSSASDTGTTFRDHLERTQSKPDSAPDASDESKSAAPKPTAKKSKSAKSDKAKAGSAKGKKEPQEEDEVESKPGKATTAATGEVHAEDAVAPDVQDEVHLPVEKKKKAAETADPHAIPLATPQQSQQATTEADATDAQPTEVKANAVAAKVVAAGKENEPPEGKTESDGEADASAKEITPETALAMKTATSAVRTAKSAVAAAKETKPAADALPDSAPQQATTKGKGVANRAISKGPEAAAIATAPTVPGNDAKAPANDEPSTPQTPVVTLDLPTPSPVAHAQAPQSVTAPPPVSPEVRFAEVNHPNIVSDVRASLLPKGGTMQIRLDPPELGALQVTVEMRNGTVNATFQTSNDDATRLLSHSLGQLKSALESQGVNVDRIQVQQAPRDQNARNGEQQSNQQQNHQQQQEAQREQQRKEMLRRMWRRLAGVQDSVDLVA